MTMSSDGYGVLSVWRLRARGVSRRIALRMGVLRLAASCILLLRVCRSAWV